MEKDFLALRERIEDQLDAGADFNAIEAEIDATDFTDDHKAALWLVAWSYLPPSAQRGHALQSFALVMEGHRNRNDSECLAGVMEAVRDHVDNARRRVGGLPPDVATLERRVRAALSRQ